MANTVQTAGAPAPHPALDDLARLLEEQAQALLHGHADLLPGLGRELHRRLALLQAAAARMAWTAEARERLAWLRLRAQSNQVLLSRRLVEVQKSLEALSRGVPLLRETQTQQLYARAGQMGAPAWRPQALASA